MRSTVRAYSHQGHGPRADQQAGYKSATSDSTPHLRRAAGPYKRGMKTSSPPPSLSGICGLGEATFARMGGKEEDAPIPAVPVSALVGMISFFCGIRAQMGPMGGCRVAETIIAADASRCRRASLR